VVPAPQRGRWIGAGVALALVAGFAYVVVSGEGVRWEEIPRYLLDPTILAGVRLTLLFTLLAMALGLVGGLVLELLRQSQNPVLTSLAGAYIWFFRGTPLLVQIIFWFNIQLFIPRVAIGPLDLETNRLVSPFTAALLALSLNEAAYLAEIIRAALISVDAGQSEAATALGFTPLQTLRRIVLPQAALRMLPPAGNLAIELLKNTALASTIALTELTFRAQALRSETLRTVEIFSLTLAIYFVLAQGIRFGMDRLERRLSVGQEWGLESRGGAA